MYGQVSGCFQTELTCGLCEVPRVREGHEVHLGAAHERTMHVRRTCARWHGRLRQVESVLVSVNSWSFNAFELNEASSGKPLSCIG